MHSSPPAYPAPPAHPAPTAGPFAVKRVGVAYVCLVFLGGLGAHHFYLRHAKRGAALLLGSLFGVLPLVLTAFQVFPGERANVLSYVAAAALAAWLVIDP